MITTPNALPAEAAKPERETWMQWIARSRYFTLSLTLHILAVIIFGTIILQQASEDDVAFTGDSGILLPSNLPNEESEPDVKIPEPAGGEITEVKVPSMTMSALTTNAMSAPFAMNATPNMSSLLGVAANAAGLNGGPGGLGRGMGIGGGGGTKMKFLGTTVTAKDVVLVLDVSSSMISGIKNEKTYEVLEREACNVIRGLTEVNKFGVVVFSKEAKVYQEKLVKAHSDEKSRAVAWLKQMTPLETRDPRAEDDAKNFHHGTRADLALKAAFDLNPDVIFFVSDGEPTGTTVGAILDQVQKAQGANNKFIDIHAIAYLADDGQKFMKDLALQNRGTFREVNPKDIK